jgi:hypothetical protein
MMMEIVSYLVFAYFIHKINYEKFSEGIQRLKEKAKKKKGRGFGADTVSHRETIDYESVRDDNEEAEPGPQRCKFLRNIPAIINF